MKYEELGHLDKAPVVYVFCKVGFATLPLLDHGAANNIAEQIRKNFPIFKHNKTSARTLTISAETNEIKSESTEDIIEWDYIAPDYSKGFVLSKNSMIFHTKKYHDSTEFLGWIRSVLDIVHTNLDISHTNFHGIRYIDRIDLKENDDFDNVISEGFFQPSLKSVSGKLGAKIECAYKTEVGVLNIKSLTKYNGHDIPDDLVSEADKLKAVNQIKNIFTIIDTDSFERSENMEEFAITKSISKIDELHKVASMAFREIIIGSELKKWRT